MKNTYVYRFLLMFSASLLFAASSYAQDQFERLYRTSDDRSFSDVAAKVSEGGAYYTLSTVFIPDSAEFDRLNVTRYDSKGTPTLSRDYEIGDGNYRSGDVLPLDGGEFIIAYTYLPEGATELQKVLTKCDAVGTPIWTSEYFDLSTAGGGVLGQPIFDGLQDLDSLTFIYGTDLTELGIPASQQFHMARLDQDGMAFWSHEYADANVNTSAFVMTDFKVTPDTSVIVCGTMDSFLFPETFTFIFVTKLDLFGNVLWSRKYKGTTAAFSDINALSITPTADSGYAVSGFQEIGGRRFGFLMKIDADGEYQYAFNASDSPIGNTSLLFDEILERSDGYILNGYFEDGNGNASSLISYVRSDTFFEWSTLLKDTSTLNFSDYLLTNNNSFGANPVEGGYFSAHETNINAPQSLLYMAKVDNDGNTLCNQELDYIIEVLDSGIIRTDTLIINRTNDFAADDIDMDTSFVYSNLLFPPPKFMNNPPPFCEGEDIEWVFRPMVNEPNMTYEWFDGSTADTFLATDVGNYAVTITINNDYCYSICDTGIITTIGPPQPNIAVNNTICSNDTAILTAIAPGADAFDWTPNGEMTRTIIARSLGSYSVTASNRCGSNTASVTLSETLPIVSIEVVDDKSVCLGDTVTLIATVQNDTGVIWQGTNNRTDTLNNVTTPGPHTITASNRCGSTQASVEFDSRLSATLTQIDLQDSIVCRQGFVRVQLDTLNALGFTFNEGADADTSNIISIPLDDLPKDITATAFNLCDTLMSNTLSINADNFTCTCVEIPNIFAPSTEGLSGAPNLFRPNIACDDIENFNLKIFSRWGQLVFETSDVNMAIWDGNFEGKPMPTDVYVWIVSYIEDGQQQQGSGDVTLLR